MTPDRVEAMTPADRIVVLNAARRQQMGTPAEDYASPANTFVAGLIRSPSMTLIGGEVAQGAFRHPCGQVAIEGLPGPAIQGVQPVEVALAEGLGDLGGAISPNEPHGNFLLLGVDIGGARVFAKLPPGQGREVGARGALSPARARLRRSTPAAALGGRGAHDPDTPSRPRTCVLRRYLLGAPA